MPRLRPIVVAVFLLGVPTAVHAAPTAAARAHKERADGLAKRDVRAAERAYQDAVKADPTYFEAFMGLGQMQFAQGRYADAAASFKEARAVNPRSESALYNLAYALRKAGRHVEAMEHYRLYVERKPNDPDGFYGLAEAEQAAGFGKEAAAHYRRYVALEKRASEKAWVERARERAQALEREFAAVPSLEDALEKRNAPAPAEEADEDDGEVYARPATPPPPPPDDKARSAAFRLALDEGDTHLARGAYAAAHAAYHSALAADPTSVEVHHRLGVAYAMAGDTKGAALAFARAQQLLEHPEDTTEVDLSPPPVTSSRWLPPLTAPAAPRPATEDPTQVLSAANQAYNKGVTKLREKDYTGALKEFDLVLQLKPDHTLCHVARGTALVALQRPQDAVVSYQQALRHDPSLSAPLFGMAEAYRAMGDRDRARDHYARYLGSQGADKDNAIALRAARYYADLSQQP
ncbi:MAG: tetratricopeptide repeat protein [Myxococcota bacterium]